MNDVNIEQLLKVTELERELQQQKGMLWVLGEIMKVANNMDTLKQLMKLVTDMLMGVTGVNTCYLWASYGKNKKVFVRSTSFNNDFLELSGEYVHPQLTQIQMTTLYNAEEITYPLIEGSGLPQSRLVVPLMDFTDNTLFGGLVLEQHQQKFFTPNNIVFFETLTTFIAQNAKNSCRFETVSEASERDPLTGVYNRRHLETMLSRFIQKYGYLSVAIIDTDNFKQVNDALGHIQGDEVLQCIAKEAKTFFKPYGGKIVRYGGDEFVFLLPQPLKEAVEAFKIFQESVPKLGVIQNIRIPVSITVGVSSYPELTNDVDGLIQSADCALMCGKSKGKNQVVIAKKEIKDCKRV